MFRVLKKVNALFVRPAIRENIKAYQKPLVGSVKDSIRSLEDPESSLLRHSSLSHKYADVNKEKQKDAEVMMHSLKTQSEYVKTED